jgi:hypothetical protein
VNGHRLCLPAGLLATLCISCDTPIEPVVPTDVSNSANVRVNAPSDLAAAAASHDLINLSWRDNSTNETGFEVHRSTAGPTGTFEFRLSTEANAISASDGGLAATTQYCYRIRAFRKTGNKLSHSSFTTTVCATTGVVPRPAAPSGLKATPLFSGFRTDISWADNSTNETGFRVERSTAAMETWTLVATTGANATSLQYREYLGVEQPVCFRVFAVNSFGNSDPSNTDCPVVPATPTGLAAAVDPPRGNNVKLTWTDNSSVEDGYVVERYSEGQLASVVATLAANTTMYQDAGLADNTYGYWVRASKNGATSQNSNSAEALIATTVPGAPFNLYAVPGSSTVVNVTWQDGAVNETEVRVERSTDDGGTWVPAATLARSSTSFGEGDRASEQRVCYQAIAFNEVGPSAPSNMGCATPAAGPTNFNATVAGPNAVTFTWADNSGVEDGYHIIVNYADYYYGYTEVIAIVDPVHSDRLGDVTSYTHESFFYWGYPITIAAINDGGYSDYAGPIYPSSQLEASSARPRASGRLLAPQRTTRTPIGPEVNRRP